MAIFNTIGQNLRTLRHIHHYSQEKIALDADIGLSNYRCIEHGTANPTIETLRKLAEVYKIDVIDLLKSNKPSICDNEEFQKELYLLTQIKKLSPEERDYISMLLDKAKQLLK